MYRLYLFTFFALVSLVLAACGTFNDDNQSEPTEPSTQTDASQTTEPDEPSEPEPIDYSQLADPLLVRGVMDGDTFEVLKDGEVYRVRMKGIDTPELSGNNDRPEPCAENAKQFLWETIGNSQVDLEFDSSCGDDPYNTCVDTYDRLLAYVRIYTGEDLATLILKRGLGQVYRFNNESFDRLATYNSAEDIAQANDLGIWDSTGQSCR